MSSILFYLLLLVFLKLLSSLVSNSTPSYGPKSHPLIGSLIPFYKNRHCLLNWYTDLLAASPTQTITMDRLGAPRTIITANPDNVEHILKKNFPNYPKGKPFTDLLGDLLGCGIFNIDGDRWLTQRKLASHEFTTRSLTNLIFSAIESEANSRLLPLLSSACHNSHSLDLQDLLRRFAFDVICRISLGTDSGFLESSMPQLDSPLADAFEVASGISARRGASPVFAVWKLKRAMGIGSERQLHESVKLIHKSVMEIIQQPKEEEENNRNDLLSRLIAGGHSDEVIRDMVISFIMAGRDTTSAALTWFFWLISCHPNTEAELVKEVMDAKLDYNGLKEMKYLEACLCETMRLYPPVAWDSKHAENDDVLPDGTRVSKGDRVTYFQYGMGRMECIWGKDWMEFQPGRWLSAEGREVVKVSPYKYPVFHAGPRVCLGKDMAFVQMKYIAAAVLQCFRVKYVSMEPPTLVPLLTAHMAGGLKVVVGERRR